MTDSSNFNKAFDSNMSGDKSNLRVHLINPPSDNPWRTQGDYKEEQKEARERHAMFQEQHKAVIRSHLASIFAAVFAGVAALATCALVFLSYQQIYTQQADTSKQQQAPKQQPPTKPLDQK